MGREGEGWAGERRKVRVRARKRAHTHHNGYAKKGCCPPKQERGNCGRAPATFAIHTHGMEASNAPRGSGSNSATISSISALVSTSLGCLPMYCWLNITHRENPTSAKYKGMGVPNMDVSKDIKSVAHPMSCTMGTEMSLRLTPRWEERSTRYCVTACQPEVLHLFFFRGKCF